MYIYIPSAPIHTHTHSPHTQKAPPQMPSVSAGRRIHIKQLLHSHFPQSASLSPCCQLLRAELHSSHPSSPLHLSLTSSSLAHRLSRASSFPGPLQPVWIRCAKELCLECCSVFCACAHISQVSSFPFTSVFTVYFLPREETDSYLKSSLTI